MRISKVKPSDFNSPVGGDIKTPKIIADLVADSNSPLRIYSRSTLSL